MRATKAAVAVAMPDRWPTKLSAVRSADRIARALPAIVINLVPAAIAMPSRPWGFISIAGSMRRNAASTSGRPETTPGLRATTTARPLVSSGIVAIDVTSPARPRSSLSARVTAASISSGETKASEQKSDIGTRYKHGVGCKNSYLVLQTLANPCPAARASHARTGAGHISFGRSGLPLYIARLLKFATDRGGHDYQRESAQSFAIGRHCGRRCRHLAHAGVGHRHGLPDHADRLRSAFDDGLFLDAAVERQPLGPRRVRVRTGFAESAVGHRPAARRHDRRSLRHHPRRLRWRVIVRGRPGADVARDQRAGARCVGGRVARFRSRRLLVPGHSRGVRQDIAEGIPLDRVWLRHFGGIVRTISLFADRRPADGYVRLAADAHHLRGQHAGRAAAVAGTGHA